MKKAFIFVIFLSLFFGTAELSAQNISIYSKWRVLTSSSSSLGSYPFSWYSVIYNDSKWREVTAPFGYEASKDPCGIKGKLKSKVIGGSSTKPLYLYGRLTINLQKVNGYSKIYLYFEGDLQEFYINGKRILYDIRAVNQCQYIKGPVIISVKGSNYFNKGKNVLAVKIKSFRNGLAYFALSSSNDQCYIFLSKTRNCIKTFFGYFLSSPPGKRCSPMGTQKCDRKFPLLPSDETSPLVPNLGYWGNCSSKASVNVEVCNGIDDDCNGKIDDGIPSKGCTISGQKGLCAIGYTKCICIGYFGSRKCRTLCLPKYKPSTEICDGKDNDCDGKIDETFPGMGNLCKTKKPGVCALGSLACGCLKWGYFPPTPQLPEGNDKLKLPPFPKRCIKYGTYCKDRYKPSTEICDGKDNDCDGKIDETFPGMGSRCVTGKPGICKYGILSCGCVRKIPVPQLPGDGSSEFRKIPNPTCLKYSTYCKQIYRPGKELCDGKDNDCDGKVDEDFSSLGKPCGSGVGICAGKGKFVCKKDGLGVQCSVVGGGKPRPEICNALDDDCDGKVDEDLKRSCRSKCGTGVETCSNGNWGRCSAPEPSPEVCDGKDNDCNGKVDDISSEPCYTKYPAPCDLGTTSCERGQTICVPKNKPKREICNNIDDDCDGVIDNNCIMPDGEIGQDEGSGSGENTGRDVEVIESELVLDGGEVEGSSERGAVLDENRADTSLKEKEMEVKAEKSLMERTPPDLRGKEDIKIGDKSGSFGDVGKSNAWNVGSTGKGCGCNSSGLGGIPVLLFIFSLFFGIFGKRRMRD